MEINSLVNKIISLLTEIMLDFLSLLWYCVVLTGGADYGKHYKRTVARQHRTARGQQNELEGDERAPWVYGAAS